MANWDEIVFEAVIEEAREMRLKIPVILELPYALWHLLSINSQHKLNAMGIHVTVKPLPLE